MAEKTNPREAVSDMASALQGVFKKYSRTARRRAWDDLTSGTGKTEIEKILTNPNRSLNAFKKLQFAEWLENVEADWVAYWLEKGWDVKDGELLPTLDFESMRQQGFMVGESKPHPTQLPQYSMVIEFSRYTDPNRNPSTISIVIPYNNGQRNKNDALAAARQIVEKEKGRYSKAAIYEHRKFVGNSILNDETYPRKLFHKPYQN